ncbi:hypothetical protein NXY11_01945 [Parabacteroides faecis]|uniref:hypothetical protein n=1 Tax=Parabacteroides faecis TaxID=1217282 RepID=UPI002164901B|nr:hypothetical protein [Parabacteroides faecis]MCS2894371.1 hypothetical protein [Parabacteroides faecis]UVQ47040.1 hypothetical protein NXY11_01945 [Parabacteroides faecis]
MIGGSNMLKKTETLSTTYTKSISDDIIIRYSVKQQDGEPVQSINANIVRSDTYVGTSNMDADGAIGINLIKGLSAVDKKSILESLVDDSEEIFAQKTEA